MTYLLVASMLGFTCHVVRGFPSLLLVRARLCWGGGSVAI